jgi:hypothetical protein
MLYFLTIYIIIVMLELAATNGGKKWRGLKILTFFFVIRLLMAHGAPVAASSSVMFSCQKSENTQTFNKFSKLSFMTVAI